MTTATDPIHDAVVALTERLEYELRGAWRAGYDYVHVYEDAPGLARTDFSDSLTLRQYVLPLNQQRPPRPESRRYRYTYDLTSVPDNVIREAIRAADTDTTEEAD